MALSIFTCADKVNYNNVSNKDTPVITKIDNFDVNIYKPINLYMIEIYNDSIGYKDSDDDDLKNMALTLLGHYDEFNKNRSYYRDLFRNEFNKLTHKNYSTVLTDMVARTYKDFAANFPEYHLMVKQTEKYTCVYYKAFQRVMDFFIKYGIGGSIMCVFDDSIEKFNKKISDLINWIETNKITDDMSNDDVKKQRLKNAYNSYDQYQDDLNNLIEVIQEKGEEVKELYLAIESFMFEVKLALKTISLGNIILTSKKDESRKFDDFAKTMLAFQPEYGADANLLRDDEHEYYLFKSNYIIKYGVPVFTEFRQYVKPDWSNFESILVESVQQVLVITALYTYSGIILADIPKTEDF